VNLTQLQNEQAAWAERNFGTVTVDSQLLGVMEEVGELAHAVLKSEQGIRGSRELHNAEAADATGDIVIYLAGVASTLGIDMEQAVTDTWASVSQRDWRKHPETGRADGSEG
jgi:NTP pyrophosphatase (non-canonical NTP hydrolase)